MALGLRGARRFTSVLLAALSLQATALVATPAFAQADTAKASLAAGDKAARDKSWSAAIAAYDAANKASPSPEALEGLANAYYQSKADAEAYAAYDRYLKDYGAKIPAAKKKTAETRQKEIADRTGTIALDASEPGATVTIDDKPAGTTPLAGPLRLPVGPHRVRVTKDGFVPFDQVPNVAAGATTNVTAKLEAMANKGRLSVHEKTGQPIRVLVDNVDMGDAPWSGDVAAGPHDVGGRGPTAVAPPQHVNVERGKTLDVEITAASSVAPLRVVTNDGKGIIYLDGKVVGEGQYAQDVAAGPHKLRITREGYDPFEEDIVLKPNEPLSRSVTMKLSGAIETGKIQAEGRRVEGIYGGFGLLYMALPGGMKSSIQTLCDGSHPAELASCDDGGGFGGSLNGFIGYHWDPIGVELFLGAQYDQSSPKLVWNASSTDPGVGPDPARTESFGLHRAGGYAAVRVRLTLQSEKWRFSAAGGVGLAYTEMLLTRDTTLASDSSIHDGYAPDAIGYLSPLLSLDPSVQYRLTPTVAVSLGLSILLESARAFDAIPTTPSDATHRLGASPLTTPAYDLTTGTQFYFGPFIGMMFGP